MVNYIFDTSVLRGLPQNSLNNTNADLLFSRSLGDVTKRSSDEISVVQGNGGDPWNFLDRWMTVHKADQSLRSWPSVGGSSGPKQLYLIYLGSFTRVPQGNC